MSRKVLLLLAAALLISAPALAQKTVGIGFSLPLTGEHAQYGEVFRNSATMAVETFNASGKLPGAKVAITFEDSKSDPKEAIAIAQKFIDDKNIVGVLGDFSSTVAMAAGREYASAGMPQLSPTASHPDYTKVSEFQFRNITTQKDEGPFVADWAVANKHKNFAIIAVQNDWGRSAAENFKAAIEARGGQGAVEYFNPGTRDFRAILTKVQAQNPEALYLCMMYEEGASILQQRKQLGITTPTYATSSLYAPKLLELAGEAAEGVLLSTTFVVDNPASEVKSFVEEYKKRFGAEPNMFAAQGFDATSIMLDAIKRAASDKGGVTRAAVRDALAKTTDFPGVTGKTSFDPVSREPKKSLSKMQVKGGKFVLMQ